MPYRVSSEDISSSISDAFSSSCFGHIFTWFMCHVFLILQDVEDASFQPIFSGLIPLISLVHPEGTAETVANTALRRLLPTSRIKVVFIKFTKF